MPRPSRAERAALNERLKEMCAAKGWEFKPWEWPRPYHDLGPPEPGENEHTRKARRLRAQLLAELEAGEQPGSPARGCVLLQIMTAAHQEDIEIVLAPASALDAVLKLIGALTKLEQGEPDMTINNPTTEQIAVLIAEYQAACAAFDAIADDAPEDAYEAATRRSMVASTDLLAARPTEPAAMALQLKWIVADLEDAGSPSVEDILAHVADRLEAMAGAVVLPPIEAATTTRPRPIDVGRMLVAALDGMVERIVDLMCEDPFAKLEAQANLYAGIAEACSEKARVASMSMLKDEPDDKPDED